MWGGIFAGAAQIVGTALQVTRAFSKTGFNGHLSGRFNFWDPNQIHRDGKRFGSLSGGTIIRHGITRKNQFWRLDAEIARGFHLHIRPVLKWHISIGRVFAGIMGGKRR